MGKQGVPQRGGVAHRRLGGKILRGQAAGKADESQQQQKDNILNHASFLQQWDLVYALTQIN